MRWFKHFTDEAMEEECSQMIRTMGWAWYGRMMRIKELIAAQMDGSDRCWVEYSVRDWCVYLGCQPKKLRSFLKCFESVLKTYSKQNDCVLKIECRNLLSARDEYSRKSGQVSGQCRSRSRSRSRKEINNKEGGSEPVDDRGPDEDIFPEGFEPEVASKPDPDTPPATSFHQKAIAVGAIVRNPEEAALWDGAAEKHGEAAILKAIDYAHQNGEKAWYGNVTPYIPAAVARTYCAPRDVVCRLMGWDKPDDQPDEDPDAKPDAKPDEEPEDDQPPF